MTHSLPSLFISHGSPTLGQDDAPVRDFLRHLGQALPRPKAILVISAHFNAPIPVLTGALHPETIHDFQGFPEELYTQLYPAAGSPALAETMRQSLVRSGFEARLHPTRGLDHGAWVPLQLIYPAAEFPIVQLSISMNQTPEWHYRLGKALASYRDEGVLIIGSGALTHNLRALFTARLELHSDTPEWVNTFADWVDDKTLASDDMAVLNALETGPHGLTNHPTPDHILPLFAALGAGSDGPRQLLHKSSTYGILRMDAFAFGAHVQAV
ncbi:DODA-type extradiol aromatic ring-opening family dioxygenase [Hyphomonas pacifica]|uniref:Extradiol ring-cleavage dioxygenase class III enzyme subunit B domain-containing protein n=1 Tax=Hyphomonas pacifica TaxID=1280941 RepID=A0A062TSQ9_9PROT|nr:class III extradiol ring-cleavage dioxygenase [Hyphomonas pacifica]KCZ50891.1 hypothetical protein HY2_12855 [Hyphomonas pacifica]RAN33476.1 hypothetical protein HY3_13065 [Hyphomonas pacifica]